MAVKITPESLQKEIEKEEKLLASKREEKKKVVEELDSAINSKVERIGNLRAAKNRVEALIKKQKEEEDKINELLKGSTSSKKSAKQEKEDVSSDSVMPLE